MGICGSGRGARDRTDACEEASKDDWEELAEWHAYVVVDGDGEGQYAEEDAGDARGGLEGSAGPGRRWRAVMTGSTGRGGRVRGPDEDMVRTRRRRTWRPTTRALYYNNAPTPLPPW